MGTAQAPGGGRSPLPAPVSTGPALHGAILWRGKGRTIGPLAPGSAGLLVPRAERLREWEETGNRQTRQPVRLPSGFRMSRVEGNPQTASTAEERLKRVRLTFAYPGDAAPVLALPGQPCPSAPVTGQQVPEEIYEGG